jgi:antitoxin HicB
MTMWYQIVIDADDNGTFMVTAPAFPEVTTFGRSQPEACQNGRSAIEEAIAARIADGDDIPHPIVKRPRRGGRLWVGVPALVYLKSALYMLSRQKRVTKAELARRLKWHREQVDRLFRLDHNSQLDQLEAAFEAIGVPLRFDVPFPRAA